ncbi:hypothetical protein ACEPPN_001376 [Leptodophora sp. 'Broadleaf-Isolate-01']
MSMNIDPRTSGAASRRRHIDNDSGQFLCEICSKAFTKRMIRFLLLSNTIPSAICSTFVTGTSRNRHVLYCRKKLVDNLPVLRKSCAACRKAKAKCDSELPNCGRCDARGLTCVYELTRKSAASAKQPAFAPPDQPSSDGTLLVDIPEPGNRSDISWNAHADNSNDAQISLDVDASSLWLAPVPDLTPQNDLSLWEPDAGFVEDLEVPDMGANISSNGYSTNGSPINWFISGPTPSLTLDPTFSTPADCMFHTPYLVLRPMDRHLSPISPRSPFIRAYLSRSSEIGRTFLLQNFKSYATALTTKNLPPFIHSTSLPSPDPSSCQTPTCATPPPLPALEICKSIVSLYTTKTPATSSFVWRTITMEKDRFMSEYMNGDEWTVLSMLQAITLYILLRIFDEDSFSVEFDRELIRAMTVRL